MPVCGLDYDTLTHAKDQFSLLREQIKVRWFLFLDKALVK